MTTVLSIQLAVIASVRDTPTLSCEGDIDLAFAHLCANNANYCNYFRNSARFGRMVILDNGIMELGSTVDEGVLLDVTRVIRPMLLTPPEVLGDGRETIALTRDFIARMPEIRLPKETGLLGVVHGRTWGEWIENYRVFHNELDAIVRIGIPYDMTFEVPGVDESACATEWVRMLENRVRAVELLDEAGLNKKPAHLLGTVDAIEFLRQQRFTWVASNDSSTAYVSAQRGVRYDPTVGIHAFKHKIDMMSALVPENIDLFLQNVSAIRNFATRKNFREVR